MSDVTIPAEVARRIAGVLRFHAETVPRSPAGEQWSALADLLDPGEQPKPVCQWGECDRPVQARGYCKTHYTSARRYRGMKRIDLSESERFWAKVRIAGTPSGCWVEVAAEIGQVCGAVSMCWDPRPTGLFESTIAGDLTYEATDAVLAVVRRHVEALPMSSIYGIDRLDRDDVLRLLNGGGK